MIVRPILGIISSLVVLVGVIPYLKDIRQKKIHPHILSWAGWGFITALGASAMLAEGSMWVVTFLFANTLFCLLISIYSIIKKVGVWSTGLYDYVFFGLGILGLVLWQILSMPIIALVCAIFADLFFGIPTVIKTYKDPATETPSVWMASSLSALLSLFIIQSFTFHEIAYPLFLFIYDSLVLILVLKIIKRPLNQPK